MDIDVKIDIKPSTYFEKHIDVISTFFKWLSRLLLL